MATATTAEPLVAHELVEAIAALSPHRDVRHCGVDFQISPFAIYAECPACKSRVKVRAFSATPEIEDVFDAVFAWMNQPEAMKAARNRISELAADSD